jgi:putative phosphoribosyl transferase
MFEDRKEAGQKLAIALASYKNDKPIVLAIPRGGVEVGFYVADFLRAPLSIIMVRKLPFPYNSESGFGAIAEDGTVFLLGDASITVAPDTIKKIIKEQKDELKRRIKVLRNDEPLPEIKDRTVILVDDGIAMGSTMRAAIILCRNKGARKVVVAAPVTAPSTAAEFKRIADDVVILEKPANFNAVAQVYRNWYDVSDEEVIEIMGKLQINKEENHG